MFDTVFPRKGTLTLTPRVWMGGGGPFRTPQNPKQSSKSISYENCWHIWDIFQKISQNTFKTSSYTQKKTPSPINTFKETTYNTKHTNNTQIHFNKSKHFENKKMKNCTTWTITQLETFQNCRPPPNNKTLLYFIIYQNSIVHILYSLYICTRDVSATSCK